MNFFSLFSRRFVIGVLFIVLAAVLQSSGVAAVSGVRPNLLLIVLTILAFFFRDWTSYLGFLSIALVFARAESGFEVPYLVIAIIAGAVFLFKERLPGSQLLNMVLAVVSGTVLTYAFSDPTFLGNDPFTVFIEVIYNVLIGIVVYLGVERFIGYEAQFRTSR